MNNLTVGIDANEGNVKNKVGVNRYAFELLLSLYKLQADYKKKKKPINYVLYLRKRPREDMPKETSWWKYKVLPARGLWILTKLTPHLLTNPDRLDVFFSPSHYLPPILTIPGVCSIMDLGYLESSGQFRKKDFWQLKLWTAKSLSISKQIIAISKSTKKDIVRHYSLTSEKITVTHLSFNKEEFNKYVSDNDVRRVRKRYTIVGDYILFLGTLKPSKNVKGLIDAYFSILNKGPSTEKLKLVIAGKKGWLYDSVFEKTKELGIESNVIFTDFIPDQDRAPLIKGARVFVLPSFWEGFGLDPLYSLAVGTPVVVSNVGSLPEVVGRAGRLVDPKNTNDISKKILEVLNMGETQYNRVVEKGFKQAEKFSWEETAQKTVGVFKKAVL